MSEVLVQFDETLAGRDGVQYIAKVLGEEDDIHRWIGWLEFEALDGSGVLRTDHETVQPNRRDLEYWATGLTRVYLHGALVRARDAAERSAAREKRRSSGVNAKSPRDRILETVRRRTGRPGAS